MANQTSHLNFDCLSSSTFRMVVIRRRCRRSRAFACALIDRHRVLVQKLESRRRFLRDTRRAPREGATRRVLHLELGGIDPAKTDAEQSGPRCYVRSDTIASAGRNARTHGYAGVTNAAVSASSNAVELARHQRERANVELRMRISGSCVERGFEM